MGQAVTFINPSGGRFYRNWLSMEPIVLCCTKHPKADRPSVFHAALLKKKKVVIMLKKQIEQVQ